MGKNIKQQNIYIRDQTLFFKNNNEWSIWRDNSLTLGLRKKFIKIKKEEKIIAKITLTSELTYLQFLKCMGELTYKILCQGNNELIFTVSSAVEYIHKKIEEEMGGKYRGQKKIEKITEQKYIIVDQAVKYNIDALNRKLNIILPGCRFFERINNDYRLLIYTIDAPDVKDGKRCRIPLVPDSTILEDAMGAIIQFGKKVDELKTIKVTHLQSLEQYLKKDMENNTLFLQKIGPIWIDSESSNHEDEREDVFKIIDNFEEKPIQSLVGYADVKKNIEIAGNVGYKLMKERDWNVLFLFPKSFEVAKLTELTHEINLLANQKKKSLVIIIVKNFKIPISQIDYWADHIKNNETAIDKLLEDYKNILSDVEYLSEHIKTEKIKILSVMNYPLTKSQIASCQIHNLMELLNKPLTSGWEPDWLDGD